MDILKLLKGYRTRRIQDYTFYLDPDHEDGVMAIYDHLREMYTYIEYQAQMKMYILSVGSGDGLSTRTTVCLKDTFIVPDIEKHPDARTLFNKNASISQVATPEIIFFVKSYGKMDDPMMRAEEFVGGRFNVLIENAQCVSYEIKMSFGKDAFAGGIGPTGTIERAYKFYTPLNVICGK